MNLLSPWSIEPSIIMKIFFLSLLTLSDNIIITSVTLCMCLVSAYQIFLLLIIFLTLYLAVPLIISIELLLLLINSVKIFDFNKEFNVLTLSIIPNIYV